MEDNTKKQILAKIQQIKEQLSIHGHHYIRKFIHKHVEKYIYYGHNIAVSEEFQDTDELNEVHAKIDAALNALLELNPDNHEALQKKYKQKLIQKISGKINEITSKCHDLPTANPDLLLESYDTPTLKEIYNECKIYEFLACD